MYRRHGQKLVFVFAGCDLGVTALAWLGGYGLRFALLPAPNGVPPLSNMLQALPLVLLMAALAYRLCGLYEIHRLRQLPRELSVACQATGLLFLLTITLAFYRRDLYESRLALGLFAALNVALLALSRRGIWHALKYLRGLGLNRGKALIVGSGRTARLVAQIIGANGWTGLEAAGYVDRFDRGDLQGLPRLGGLERLADVVCEHRVDHLFVALPVSRYGELPELWRMLGNLLLEVQFVPDLPRLSGMKIRTMELDQVAFLSLRENPHFGVNRVVKRAMDVAIGTAALLVCAPLMAALALAVKLTSRGPVLYRQQRASVGGRAFDMLKFRSMRIDAEHTTGPVWATRHDPRTTRLGRLLRRTNLDELPQLFNVLRGEMSLVGPRPERQVFIEKFRHTVPNYALRHQVKAGMTGWAQVQGWRGNTSLRKRIECDLYYITHWSPWLDLKILWLTIWRAFRDRNAY